MARPATARLTDGLSGWLRSALPGVVIEARDAERGRHDRVVDAAVYLVAFAIIEQTQTAGREELTIVAAQDHLDQPKPRFSARRLG